MSLTLTGGLLTWLLKPAGILFRILGVQNQFKLLFSSGPTKLHTPNLVVLRLPIVLKVRRVVPQLAETIHQSREFAGQNRGQALKVLVLV